MEPRDLLVEAFTRIQQHVHRAVADLAPEDLGYRADPDANSIAWLIWHLSRVQDDHVSELAGIEQRWTAAGWFDRFHLPFDERATGYGQSRDEVARLGDLTADLLTGYFDEVHEATLAFVRSITADQLDRVVDRRWDPPVTMGVRLVSVIDDDIQHAGQAMFVRGLVERRG
ncbi:Protein of unknown function [Paramicrobacterium humi]|uniref:DinB superfamily protein n=1 Tax=Paramicrobacterium humi TaxID=640635 RepID=A0A1H4TED5_9MICO|nr:DUF664 domain-containing protein [Microbacterium humi]SEC54835.1 Protein of unknown function [Microbacterium humi]